MPTGVYQRTKKWKWSQESRDKRGKVKEMKLSPYFQSLILKQ
jgi:hypothetical protein